MATEIGAIKASLQLDMRNFSDGMTRAKRELIGIDDKAQKTTRSFAGLESALTAIGASAAMIGLVRVVKSLADEANELAMSMQGLVEVSRALNVDIEKSTKLAEDLADRGFMSIAEASNAVKTALSSGLNLEQTRDLINATADAAAYNREAHLGWGEAVVQVMRGIKSGNSELTDAAGITTNLSVMYDRYAKSIGTTAANLTEAQKVQAAYSGIMEEATLFTGNADKAMEGYAGTSANFNRTIAMARAEIGEAYIPALKKLMETVTPIIIGFTKWVESNKEVIAGVTAGVIAVTGLIATMATLITVMGAVRAAAIALNLSLGPIGWAITAVGLVATGVTAYSIAAEAAAESVFKFAQSQSELNDKLNESPLNRSADEVKSLQSDIETLNQLLEHQKEIRDQIASRPSMAGAYGMTPEVQKAADEARKLGEELETVNKQLKVFGIDTPDDAARVMAELNRQINEALPALRELRMEELRDIAAKQDQAAESEKLVARYSELTAKTSRTKEESAELTRTIRQLADRYPELATEMDAQGTLLITNESLVRDLIAAEKDATSTLMDEYVARTKIREAEAKEALELAKTHITALQAVAGSESVTAPWLNEGNASFLGNQGAAAIGGATSKLTEDAKRNAALLNELELELASIENGTWRELIATDRPGSASAANEKTKAGAKPPTAEQLAQEAYRATLQLMEKRRLLGELTEKQEIDTLARLAKQYAKYDDIWIDAEGRRQRVVEQMAADNARTAEERARQSEAVQRAGYEHSAEWIEAETRRMTEKGESEESIARMTLEAWTRVRNRYTSDTDFYKRADIAMYNARMSLRRIDEAAAVEAAKNVEQAQKAATKSALDAIDKQRKAELDALDERKRATQKYYDDILSIIDESERGRERQTIEKEAAKYRNATSEEGKKRYAELQEQLRKMDVEDNKRTLQDERDDKLAAFDQQKRDIDAWYSDLKSAAETFNGDMITLYQLTEDERFRAFTTTNAAIKAEMARFQAEMSALANVGSSAAGGYTASTVAQMQANAKAWHTADAAGRQRLADDNKRLGGSIGANYDGGSGKWFGSDGTPLFHTGRDGSSGRTFSAGDRLMPNELAAILREDEYVFTPGQLRSLIDSVGGRGGGTNVTIERIVGVEMNDTTLEDEIDVRAIGRVGVDMAAEMARSNFTGGA